MTMHKLVLLRHGESVWNRENRFTGWTDVDLSEKGVEEARAAAQLLRAGGYTFDVAFSSVLKRAIKTLWIVQEELDLLWIPVQRSWRLNERHYGALQGLNKSETVKEFGEAQVQIWRRSYSVPPPGLCEAVKGPQMTCKWTASMYINTMGMGGALTVTGVVLLGRFGWERGRGLVIERK